MYKVTYLLLAIFIASIPSEQAMIFHGFGKGTSSLSAMLGIPIAVFALESILIRGSIRKLTGTHWLMLLFFLYCAVTYVWTYDEHATAVRTVTNIQMFLITVILWNFMMTRREVEGLLAAYLLGVCIAGVNVLVNWQLGADLLGTHRFTNKGTDPNELAVMISAGFPMAWWVLLSTDSRNKKILAMTALGLGGLAVLLTGSRTGFIAATVALVCVPLSLPGLRGVARVLAVVLVGLAVLGIYEISPAESLDRMSTIREEVSATGTIGERRKHWQAAIAVIKESPVLGTGAGAFMKKSLRYFPKMRVAHNTYLSLLAETGAVGLVLFLAVFLGVFLVLRKAEPDVRNVWLFSLAALCVGLSTLTLEQAKAPWVVVTLALCHAHCSRAELSRERIFMDLTD